MLSRTKLSEIIMNGYTGPILNEETAKIFADGRAIELYDYLLKEVFGFNAQ